MQWLLRVDPPQVCYEAVLLNTVRKRIQNQYRANNSPYESVGRFPCSKAGRAIVVRKAALAGRLLGLNVGDWSMLIIGLVLAGFLLALA
jgi:hypothetical protein